MSDTNKYVYLIVREDLSHPQQIIQTSHAVELMKDECESSGVSRMILFGVDDERALRREASKLETAGIPHSLFYEPDINGYTAIATAPITGHDRLHFRNHQLKRA